MQKFSIFTKTFSCYRYKQVYSYHAMVTRTFRLLLWEIDYSFGNTHSPRTVPYVVIYDGPPGLISQQLLLKKVALDEIAEEGGSRNKTVDKHTKGFQAYCELHIDILSSTGWVYMSVYSSPATHNTSAEITVSKDQTITRDDISQHCQFHLLPSFCKFHFTSTVKDSYINISYPVLEYSGYDSGYCEHFGIFLTQGKQVDIFDKAVALNGKAKLNEYIDDIVICKMNLLVRYQMLVCRSTLCPVQTHSLW